jgi:hypothetical protein
MNFFPRRNRGFWESIIGAITWTFILLYLGDLLLRVLVIVAALLAGFGIFLLMRHPIPSAWGVGGLVCLALGFGYLALWFWPTDAPEP